VTEIVGRKEMNMKRIAAALALATSLAVVGACGAETTAGKDKSPGTAIASSATQECGTESGTGCAPKSERIDLAKPSFSNPTNVTNPLFPVSRQKSVLMLGRVDGKAFRTEVTLLPETRIIEWQGQQVETLVSQYTAYLDGRLHEVAYDFYAQAHDGSVWYFGEDVFNFEDGAIVDTHGTWIAGKDGPAAMIMPSDPHVGDVYRPENIPGFVFEEVTVKSTGKTVAGPLGPIDGAIVVEELHMDGNTEDKTFAPGYGEFYTAGGGDVEALALAVPTDALSGPPPAELETLSNGALDIFDAARSGDLKAASATVERMSAAWETYRAGEVPKMVEPRMTDALAALAEAVEARDAAQARQAAIDAARWSLDLQLQYRPPAEIDLARLDLWAAQLVADASAGDAAAVNGDFFALDYIRDRVLHTLDGADVTRINATLEDLQGAVGDQDLAAATDAGERLRETLARLDAAPGR
jgi:uncharacterized membrane protein